MSVLEEGDQIIEINELTLPNPLQNTGWNCWEIGSAREGRVTSVLLPRSDFCVLIMRLFGCYHHGTNCLLYLLINVVCYWHSWWCAYIWVILSCPPKEGKHPAWGWFKKAWGCDWAEVLEGGCSQREVRKSQPLQAWTNSLLGGRRTAPAGGMVAGGIAKWGPNQFPPCLWVNRPLM